MSTYNMGKVKAASTSFRALWARLKPTTIYASMWLRVDSKTLIESYHIPESVGTLAVRDGESVRDIPVRFDKSLTNVEYQKMFSVPLVVINDDQLGLYRAQFEALGVNAKGFMDILIADVLKRGFTTAKSYDNVALFSDSHPIADGAVQSNLVSGALSATTFATGIAKLDAMTDHKGVPLRLRRQGGKRKLIVGPSDYATAKSIVDVATTASGAGNPNYQAAEVVLEESFTGDYDGYWMIAQEGSAMPPFIAQFRQEAELNVFDDPNCSNMIERKEVWYEAYGRFAAAACFYQSIVGSTG
jgi:phage major head subunit gpT-like protein